MCIRDRHRTYSLNLREGEEYRYTPPTQEPIDPPYQAALNMKRNDGIAKPVAVVQPSTNNDVEDGSETVTEPETSSGLETVPVEAIEQGENGEGEEEVKESCENGEISEKKENSPE